MKFPYSRQILGAMLSAAILTHAAAADNPIGRFEISRFEVEGNTLLKADAM